MDQNNTPAELGAELKRIFADKQMSWFRKNKSSITTCLVAVVILTTIICLFVHVRAQTFKAWVKHTGNTNDLTSTEFHYLKSSGLIVVHEKPKGEN